MGQRAAEGAPVADRAVGERHGDAAHLVVPVWHARGGGAISTRSFLPVRCHRSIGVLGALTVGAGIRLPGTVGHDLATLPTPPDSGTLRIEHPSGYFDVSVTLDRTGPSPTTSTPASFAWSVIAAPDSSW